MRPNRNTIGLVALLAAIGYAGASQSNAAAYLLGFVLTGTALVSMIHGWINVRGLTLGAEAVPPAFSGDLMTIRLTARATTRRSHPGIRIKANGSRKVAFPAEVAADSPQRAELSFLAEGRGRFETVTAQLSTLYPLGFFTGFRTITVRQPFFIYPAPEGSLPLPRSFDPAPRSRDGLRVEGDDFAGTRQYQPGESQRHIDWKAAARGQPLLIKQWAADADETVHLRWSDLSALPYEARLSQLARWIVVAERSGASYGIELPESRFLPDRGDAHFHACLRTLALFPEE